MSGCMFKRVVSWQVGLDIVGLAGVLQVSPGVIAPVPTPAGGQVKFATEIRIRYIGAARER